MVIITFLFEVEIVAVDLALALARRTTRTKRVGVKLMYFFMQNSTLD